MTSASQFKDLNEFLAKHSAKSEKKEANVSPTHTRIPDQALNIYGGSYIIPKEELSVFMNLYYQNVFVKKKLEYLTEKQLENNGPILIDIDLRYSIDVETRQHSREHILDLINLLYLEELKEFLVLSQTRYFQFMFLRNQR